MPSFELLGPFLIATVLVAVFPGPALLYTAARTLAGGRRAGVLAALGIHLGGYVHVAAAALGLSQLLTRAPDAFFALKIAGALYLAWLGLGMLRARSDAALPRLGPRSAGRAFLDSIAVQVLNPKTALFFIAFLPQFVDPAAAWPVWAQLLALGLIVNVTFTAADLATALLTDRVMRALNRSRSAERIGRTAAGAALIGLGAHLALTRTP